MCLEVCLVASDEEGVRLIGRSADSDLVERVRERIAAERRRELARIDHPVRLVRLGNNGAEGTGS